MNEREAETDSDTCELATTILFIGSPKDDHEEYEGEETLNSESTAERNLLIAIVDVGSTEEVAISVSGEGADGHIGSLSNTEEDSSSDDATYYLCSPISEHFFPCHASIDP